MGNNNSRTANWMEKINETVKPVIGWSVFGGTVAVAVILALIFWL